MKVLYTDIKETSNTVNIIAISISATFLFGIYILRFNLLPLLTVLDYFCLLSFIAIIFILPDYINFVIGKESKWYYSVEFNTILLLIILGTAGLIFGKRLNYVSFALLPIGLFLFVWELRRYFKKENFIAAPFGLAAIGFMILIFYSQGWHTPLFPEHLILGTAFVDILFHTSIGNMISSLGYASTGLDGAPYIHYHWGAHALFAGMRQWINFSTISFYNIAYPLIFIPLFFKSLLLLTHRFFVFKKQPLFNLSIAFTVVALLYSLDFVGFAEARAMPMNSESFGISIIFTLLFTSILLNFISHENKKILSFFIYAFLVIFLLFFFKISTGVVVFAGMSFLMIRVLTNYKTLVIIVLSMIVIGTCVYLFVYPVYRNEVLVSIGNRLLNYWYWSSGFVTYFLGIIIFLSALLYEAKSKDLFSLIKILKSGRFIDLELLAVINLAGAGVALWVTSNSGDVYYFFAVQLVLSIVYILFYIHKAISTLRIKQYLMHSLLAIIIIMSIISSPHIISGLFKSNWPNKAFADLSEDQEVLKELYIELIHLDSENNKSTTAIFIHQNETWYHNPDSSFKEVFIIPAVSGMAAISNISPKLLRSDFNYFSIAYYRKGDNNNVSSLENAIQNAKSLGYNQLITFRKNNKKLEKQVYCFD